MKQFPHDFDCRNTHCLRCPLCHFPDRAVKTGVALLLTQNLGAELLAVTDTGPVCVIQEQIFVADQFILRRDRAHLLLFFLVAVTADDTSGQIIDKRNPVFYIVKQEKTRYTGLAVADDKHYALQEGRRKASGESVHHSHQDDEQDPDIHDLEIYGI